MHPRTKPILTTLLTALLALAGGNAWAVEVSDQLELHGYGDIGHARSNVDATGQQLGANETMHNL